MKFNLFSKTTSKDGASPTDNKTTDDTKSESKPLRRQVTIEEEPDSLDSVISNPDSYPITIVPSRPASLYRYSQYGNGKAFNRQSSCRSGFEIGLKIEDSECCKCVKMQALTDVHINKDHEKDDTAILTSQWRRQYMRGVSATPSQAGDMYYEPLKGSSSHLSLVRRSRNFRPGSMRKIRRRAVLKNGECNVLQKNLAKRRLRFLQDIFTTLVDSQWRWTLLAFALSFILSWLLFAVIWWLIMFTHGDLEELHLPDNQEDSGWKPCVSAIHSFTSCFLFSIETQHTIGYGVRTTSEECPEAIFMMCFQSIYGVMSQAFMAGIVFAKMTRSKQRTQTLLFSKNAVICQRDGTLSLMFRVGDMRKSHIIGANVRAQLIRTRTSKEGEVMTQHFTELEIGTDECGSDIFFIWPMVIIHKINEDSPLYNMSATDLIQDKFEIVVILEGTVESTGQTTQARSSYVNTEILWGHRFDPVVVYNKDRQAYEIDYQRFNETTQVDTPLCSSRELSEYYKIQDGFRTPESWKEFRDKFPALTPRPLSADDANKRRPFSWRTNVAMKHQKDLYLSGFRPKV